MRADAVRNREVILKAADELFTRSTTGEGVSIEAIAERAGVGKGTVFRAFSDRAGLLQALSLHRGQAMQDQVERGLRRRSGAASVSYIIDVLLTFKVQNRSLSASLEAAGAGSPYLAQWYGWWHQLLASELENVSGVTDPSFVSHALLASIRSDLIEHLIGVEQMTETQLRRHVTRYTASVVRSR